jgi:hypothetical protein
MAIARISRGRKFGLGRRVALKVMVLGVVGLMSLAGTNPAMAATNQDNGSFWTQFTPSSDTRLIFVSSSEGDDSNNGLTPATPVKTLSRAESLLRDGFPDWMLLKRGDTWDHMLPFWSKSGRSETERRGVGASGVGGQRPKILPDATAPGAIRSQGNTETKYVAFVGLHLEPRNRADDQQITGVVWQRRSHSILFEDLYVAGFKDNFSIQSLSEAAPVENIRLNGCVVVGSWSKTSHSQGLYASRINGLLIENSVFASNGFNFDRAALPTLFNHNIYIQSSNINVSVKGNIIADASSHGLQLRPGGDASGNVFLSNPIALLLGSNGPTTYPVEGGVSGTIRSNLVMYGRGINATSPRSFGIDVTNCNSAMVSENILFSGEIGHNGQAITVADGREYGVRNVQLEDNWLIGWNGAVILGGQGEAQNPSVISFRRNRIWRDLNANNGNNNFNKPFISAFDASDPGLEIVDNWYGYVGMHSRPFISGNEAISISDWRAVYEPSGEFVELSILPSDLDISDYLSQIGLSGGLEAFIAHAKNQSRQNFNPSFHAPRVYGWAHETVSR